MLLQGINKGVGGVSAAVILEGPDADLALTATRHDVEVPLAWGAVGGVLGAGNGCHALVVGSTDCLQQLDVIVRLPIESKHSDDPIIPG